MNRRKGDGCRAVTIGTNKLFGSRRTLLHPGLRHRETFAKILNTSAVDRVVQVLTKEVEQLSMTVRTESFFKSRSATEGERRLSEGYGIPRAFKKFVEVDASSESKCRESRRSW